jgi:hypothetical protein
MFACVLMPLHVAHLAGEPVVEVPITGNVVSDMQLIGRGWDADLGSLGHWHRVLAGAYTDPETARRDVARLQSAAPASGVRLVSAEFATGTMEQ